MKLLKSLPKPDAWGHFWLGEKPTHGPVIFLAGNPKFGAPKHAGKYFASRGDAGGVLFDGGFIRYFDTPEEAYKALEECRP